MALCFDPARAATITLQPVDRFDLDAAILFSDILVIPYALGRRVDFVEGEGPRLDPIDVRAIERLDSGLVVDRLAAVLETVVMVREKLAPEKSLIGFCGAPWTVATYMIAGRGTPDQAPALAFARDYPDAMQQFVDVLVEASAAYLVAQIRAGADVVQIFDTWAGVLAGDDFERWCVQPTKAIVKKLRDKVPGAKVIGFPRGAGAKIPRYVAETGVTAVSLEADIDRDFARAEVQSLVPVQGILSPETLRAGGAGLDCEAGAVCDAFASAPFIFNLGHGILPDTPIANVEQMLKRVRG
jgi:uroporphyrinogen decarboxylase